MSDLQSGTEGKPKARNKARVLSLSDLDRRTAAYRRVIEIINGIQADLGGEDTLTVAQRQIIERAALIGAALDDLAARWLSGEPVDLSMYSAAASTQRRLLETVGLQRVAREVPADLSSYLKNRTSGDASANSGVSGA